MKSKIVELRQKYLAQFSSGQFPKSKFASDYPDIIAWAQSDKGKALTDFALAHCATRIEIIEKVESIGEALPIFKFFNRSAAHMYIAQILVMNTLQQLSLPSINQTKFGLPQKSVWKLVASTMGSRISHGTFSSIIKQAVEFGYVERRQSVVDSRTIVLVPSPMFVAANLGNAAAVSDIISNADFVEKHTILKFEGKNRRVPSALRDLIIKYCGKVVDFFDKA